MKSKHLQFTACKDEGHWLVFGKVELLGQIYWKIGWRAFVFEPLDSTFWSADCLEAVAAFLRKINARRPPRKTRRR